MGKNQRNLLSTKLLAALVILAAVLVTVVYFQQPSLLTSDTGMNGTGEGGVESVEESDQSPGQAPEKLAENDFEDPFEDIEEEIEREEENEQDGDNDKKDSARDRDDGSADEHPAEDVSPEEVRAPEDPGDDERSDAPSYRVIADGDYLLALVTKSTKLKSDYVPSDLRRIPDYMNPSYEMYLREEPLDKLEALWRAASEDGVNLAIRSAYRSYATQKYIFADFASRHGEEEANRFSARPGQSEHQLGTTIDFGGTSVDFSAAFGDTDQGRWLAENAHKFGFALSYPQGKEHVTGYIYEPWHYRYIGVRYASEWKRSGLTLKEYLQNFTQYYD